MEYAIEIASCGMIYVPGSTEVGGGVFPQKFERL
jgi:hypothetical protein